MTKPPKHLHAAYDWTDAAGEIETLASLRGKALAKYVRDSAENCASEGDGDVTASDLRELAEWLAARPAQRSNVLAPHLLIRLRGGGVQP